jgi:hypothetical protein
MSSVDTIFRTITDGDWRRSIKRSRARVNQVSLQIRQKLSAASGGMVTGKEDGFWDAPAGQPPLARGVFFPSTPTILSPVAPQPNTTRGDESSVNGNATGGNPYSCSVGRATAGRDRRNF